MTYGLDPKDGTNDYDDETLGAATARRFGSPAPRPYDSATQLEKRIARHLEEASRLERRVDFLNNLPAEPIGEDGTTVIWFNKSFGSRVYTYAAVRCVDGLWSTTGPKSPKRYRWSELIQWIYADGNDTAEVWFATAYELLGE